MLSVEQTCELWANPEEIVNEDTVCGSLDRMVEEITEKIDDTFPMVLFVVGDVIVFTRMLLPKLAFLLEFDYIHLSRYNNTTMDGEIQWRVTSCESVEGHTVLVPDGILGGGGTMAAIRPRIVDMSAAEFYSTVLCEGTLAKSEPLYPDFCSFSVSDHYVFGYGMNAKSHWRNLPTIHVFRST